MRTLFQVAAVALMLAPIGALAQSKHFEKCGSAKRITCVVDGDTIWFEGEKIRIMGYDTPEPMTDICGGDREKLLAARATRPCFMSTSRAMNATHAPSTQRWGLATLASGLGPSTASGRVSEPFCTVYRNLSNLTSFTQKLVNPAPLFDPLSRP